ncbi:MAG: sulfatase [Cyclobacteriaceae bacterium]|nr:sulfatase [Cyclobacteriaceae bacterium]
MRQLALVCFALFLVACGSKQDQSTMMEGDTLAKRPNILFIMSDDHARQAISAYDDKLIKTPHIDRLAREGVLIRNGYVTNSICAPSRAAILTSKYSHLNGLRDNRDTFDGSQVTFPRLLQEAGYYTAIVGKWHLKSVPQGFDYWNVLIDQGEYYKPRLVDNGDTVVLEGYTTDVITDKALAVLDSLGEDQPFMMMLHHKAPHRNWMPKIEHLKLFKEDLPVPDNFFDDYDKRQAAAEQDLSIDRMYLSSDLKLAPEFYDHETGTGGGPANADPEKNYQFSLDRLNPEQRAEWDRYYDSIGRAFKKANLSGRELTLWKYQRYIKDYLRSVYAVDENIGRVLDYLDKRGLTENTIVVYTSDQGFYLGEHGWYDKRFMYEESFSTPMLIRYPKAVKQGSTLEDFVMNIDFAPTFLDYAGVDIPKEMQGHSLRPLFEDHHEGWRKSMYYHYYEYPHGWHSVKKHYGIRSGRYKLIHYYDDIDTWELFDLQNDPQEMVNLIDHHEYLDVVVNLKKELKALQEDLQEKAEITAKTLP